MDRYIKQIQTRMNRQLTSRGQSVTKQQVRDVYSQVVKNPDKPTDLEMSRVTELLAKQLSSLQDASRTQEEVIEKKADGRWQEAEGEIREEGQEKEEVSAISSPLPSTLKPLPSHLEITQENNPDLWETLQPAQKEDSEAVTSHQASEPQDLTQELTQTPPSSNSSQAQSEEVGELAITQSGNNLPTHQPEATGITQTEIEQAVEKAIAQTGETGNTEAKLIMTQLALHLTNDINTLEQAVTALVTGYLNKRSNILKNAFLTLNTIRNAQTNSFCSGLTPDFLAKQETAKKQLMEIANTFN